MKVKPHGKPFTVRNATQIRELTERPVVHTLLRFWFRDHAEIDIEGLNALSPYEAELPEGSDSDLNTVEEPVRKMTDNMVKRPDPLDVNGNVSESWRRFKRSFDIFMEAADIMTKPDKQKINVLLNCVGPEAVDFYDSFTMTEQQRESSAEVIKAFVAFCTPKKNEVYERFVFYQRKQKDGESFDQFHIDIKRLARTCEFQEKENEMLRDRIVMGVVNRRLQQQLLETQNFTYETAVTKCKANEASKEQADEMNKSSPAVNELKYNSNTQHRSKQTSNERSSNNNKGKTQ